jgi:hypothetical protein
MTTSVALSAPAWRGLVFSLANVAVIEPNFLEESGLQLRAAGAWISVPVPLAGETRPPMAPSLTR